jgi:hypothetical protein
MQIREPSPRHTTGKLEQAFFDWTKRILQVAGLALVLLIAYLIYGIVTGALGSWTSFDAAAQARISTNIQGTIFYLNVAVIVLLVTSVILYYDEPSLGYLLVILAVALYFGVPYFVDSQMPGQVEAWEKARNVPMLSLYHEARVMALILIVPGIGLTLYDIVCRVLAAGRGERVDRTAMQYGGGAKEIAPANPALIGAFAACWQLPFCRESLRVRCPIYHLRRKCWRERVGCMCEEIRIREALARFFDRQEETGNLNFATGLQEAAAGEPQIGSSVQTGPREDVIRIPEIRKDQIKIPVDNAMPIEAKRARCRECVIYNEHQRYKYQLLAPIVTLIFPVVAVINFDAILQYLQHLLSTADRVMARLSFDPHAREVGLGAATSSSDVANIIMVACLVIILTTFALRALEYVVFTLKA